MQTKLLALTQENYQPSFTLQLNCHSHPWSENVFVDSLSPPYFAKQLVQAEMTIGYYIGLQVLDESTLMDIGVKHEERGKGHAKHLLADFVQHCQLNKAQHIWLEVRKSNQHAVALYERANFCLIEERKNYYPTDNGKENALIMRKTLD